MADQNGTTPAVETAESAARALAVRAKEAREIVAAAARSENDSTSARTKEEFKWNLGYKLADRYEDDEVGAQQYLENIAVRFFVDNVLQPTLNNPAEHHAASLQMYTEPNSGIIDFKKIEQLRIRFVVKKWKKMEYIDVNVDEEDAVTILSLLVETGIADHRFLFLEDEWEWYFRGSSADLAKSFKNMRLVPDDNKRRKVSGEDDASDHTTSPRTKRGDRISAVNLIQSFDKWEFHTPRTFELLSKFDKLETLKIQHCSAFRLTETIASFPNLKRIEVSIDDETEGEISFDSEPDDFEYTFGSLAILKEKSIVSNLESLLIRMDLDDDTVATLLFDILPHCPKLQKVQFRGDNHVESFQKISRRIDEEANPLAVKSLRHLSLDLARDGYNRYFYNYKFTGKFKAPIEDAKEFSAMAKLLLTFNRLHDLGGSDNNPFRQDGRLNALLEINRARCMLEDHRNSTIPLSLWPPIIAKETSPDVIYFLLQNSVTLKNGILRQD